jgi:hypothetical protein
MKYPAFFNQVEKIVLHDPISEFLGVFEDGMIEFSYLDVVKTAGHSCPTVAGAYLVCLRALKHLYPNSIPQRGGIRIEVKDRFADGVTGVIATVFSQITGATEIAGFKGIAGQFVRHSLMDFDADIDGQYHFTRLDTGASVMLNYQAAVPIDPRQQNLMQKSIMGKASEEEKELFGQLWQERVRAILIDMPNNENIIQLY